MSMSHESWPILNLSDNWNFIINIILTNNLDNNKFDQKMSNFPFFANQFQRFETEPSGFSVYFFHFAFTIKSSGDTLMAPLKINYHYTIHTFTFWQFRIRSRALIVWTPIHLLSQKLLDSSSSYFPHKQHARKLRAISYFSIWRCISCMLCRKRRVNWQSFFYIVHINI